ncbi:hypothetical protein [Xanthobacter sp. KR7-225]|uniref:hypothetical protein n=1 Tax=Xanthobacter sp. KR7-225 TaxID=3156613 RepID=UPI0032B3718F
MTELNEKQERQTGHRARRVCGFELFDVFPAPGGNAFRSNGTKIAYLRGGIRVDQFLLHCELKEAAECLDHRVGRPGRFGLFVTQDPDMSGTHRLEREVADQGAVSGCLKTEALENRAPHAPG